MAPTPTLYVEPTPVRSPAGRHTGVRVRVYTGDGSANADGQPHMTLALSGHCSPDWWGRVERLLALAGSIGIAVVRRAPKSERKREGRA